MTIRETYNGHYSWAQIFSALDFLGFQPVPKVDVARNLITVTDPDDSKNRIVIETEDLKVKSGNITDGTITEAHFIVAGKEAITFSGMSIDATKLKAAVAGGSTGLYEYLASNLRGNLVARGDKFDNLLEIGEGGKATVDAGAGKDLIQIWHQKSAVIDGGAGIDTIDFSVFVGFAPEPANGAVVDLATHKGTNPRGGALTITNVENILGQFGASNTIKGDGLANLIQGGTVADTLWGRGGNDNIYVKYNAIGGDRATHADGGTGTDTLTTELTYMAPFIGSGFNQFSINTLDLTNQARNTGSFQGGTFTHFEVYKVVQDFNTLFYFKGSSGNERVYGTGYADKFNGGGGNDLLFGAFGADTLTGGTGADTFQYRFASDSNAAARDRITDFSHKQHDRIDLHFIDANDNTGANDKFDFIGTGRFTGHAGQVRYFTGDDRTIIAIDTNGDKTADMVIALDHEMKLFQSDFIL